MYCMVAVCTQMISSTHTGRVMLVLCVCNECPPVSQACVCCPGSHEHVGGWLTVNAEGCTLSSVLLSPPSLCSNTVHSRPPGHRLHPVNVGR